MNLVTIEVPSGSAGVAGVLRAGDLADVYEYRVTENEEGEKEAAAALRMRGLYVQDVLNRNMQSLSELDRLRSSCRRATRRTSTSRRCTSSSAARSRRS